MLPKRCDWWSIFLVSACPSCGSLLVAKEKLNKLMLIVALLGGLSARLLSGFPLLYGLCGLLFFFASMASVFLTLVTWVDEGEVVVDELRVFKEEVFVPAREGRVSDSAPTD